MPLSYLGPIRTCARQPWHRPSDRFVFTHRDGERPVSHAGMMCPDVGDGKNLPVASGWISPPGSPGNWINGPDPRPADLLGVPYGVWLIVDNPKALTDAERATLQDLRSRGHQIITDGDIGAPILPPALALRRFSTWAEAACHIKAGSMVRMCRNVVKANRCLLRAGEAFKVDVVEASTYTGVFPLRVTMPPGRTHDGDYEWLGLSDVEFVEGRELIAPPAPFVMPAEWKAARQHFTQGRRVRVLQQCGPAREAEGKTGTVAYTESADYGGRLAVELHMDAPLAGGNRCLWVPHTRVEFVGVAAPLPASKPGAKPISKRAVLKAEKERRATLTPGQRAMERAQRAADTILAKAKALRAKEEAEEKAKREAEEAEKRRLAEDAEKARQAQAERIARDKASILPDGDLIGWKQCRDDVIVKLRIPADAKRSNKPGGRKCRAEFADVLEVIGGDVGHSHHAHKEGEDFTYVAGQRVMPTTPFSDNWRDECAPGIHFFITRTEAEEYTY